MGSCFFAHLLCLTKRTLCSLPIVRIVGRAAAMELLEEGLEGPLTFSSYPKEAEWLLQKRAGINRALSEVSELAT
ncbi:hypothetical protein [Paenibacillus herberti]|uniref:Uncharacterized protein n=1 Tax=Paenibacillus herberti TaxID=1619309 RepID=A0A229NZS8_9BACL|nr:hypothetical protein [Paenibacillus herberti]OXM15463.1 hypothetical protein CGZ75_01615 [Paenibacillus herberti]